MTETKALAKRANKLLNELTKAYNKEVEEGIKNIALKKLKQIKMAEITLRKLKSELRDILSGKKEITEEDLLFENGE